MPDRPRASTRRTSATARASAVALPRALTGRLPSDQLTGTAMRADNPERYPRWGGYPPTAPSGRASCSTAQGLGSLWTSQVRSKEYACPLQRC